MSSQTQEIAFESHVEETLLRLGWEQGTNTEWDKANALFPARIVSFLKETQPKRWEEMEKAHGAGLEPLLIKTLVKELEAKGTLHVLRHGFKFYGKTLKLAYFRAAHRLNYELDSLFGKNQLTLTRQVTCHPSSNATVDILLAINGLPVATIELKNPTTGQNWRHAVKQYEQRDFRAPLFQFKKRTLVHFAADPDEIHMTTRLAGERTYFLPFNRGSHPGEIQCGKGNPGHSFGYRTGYFWEEVLRKGSFMEIIGSFMFLEKKEEKVDDGKGRSKFVTKETLIFPRYHQLDSTRKLIIEARKERAGHNYLI